MMNIYLKLRPVLNIRYIIQNSQLPEHIARESIVDHVPFSKDDWVAFLTPDRLNPSFVECISCSSSSLSPNRRSINVTTTIMRFEGVQHLKIDQVNLRVF